MAMTEVMFLRGNTAMTEVYFLQGNMAMTEVLIFARQYSKTERFGMQCYKFDTKHAKWYNVEEGNKS